MNTLKRIRKDFILYIMLLPGIVYFGIFHIILIINMKLAFQDYKIIGGNTWGGLKHFTTLFSSPAFQSVSYLLHFLSWVAISSIWITLLNPVDGGVDVIRHFFRLPSLDFITSKERIRWVFVFLEMWRSADWDTIVYIVAVLKINPARYATDIITGKKSLDTFDEFIKEWYESGGEQLTEYANKNIK